MQNTPGTLAGMDQQQQDAFGELLTMKAEKCILKVDSISYPLSFSSGEFPKLLNELLAKGAVEAAEINGRTKTNGVKRARLLDGDGEGRPGMEQRQGGTANVWAQQQGSTNGTDQFDIFGRQWESRENGFILSCRDVHRQPSAHPPLPIGPNRTAPEEGPHRSVFPV